MKLKSPLARVGAILLIVAVGYALKSMGLIDGGSSSPAPEPRSGGADTVLTPRSDTASGEEHLLEAFRAKRSGVWVETHGRVVKTLADDLEGSKHQKFIVKLSSGHTILIAHNIDPDMAPRVPLREGDDIEFRGEFEWNDRGGVVHWTHHDPRGRKVGGWIRHDGKVYK